jgi:hypothetical protein
MDFEEFHSLSRQADELLGPSLLLQKQLGLTGSALSHAARDAQLHTDFARQFVMDIGASVRFTELVAGINEWPRYGHLRGLFGDGATSSLARAVQGYVESPARFAAMGYLDSPPIWAATDFHNNDAICAARELVDGFSMEAARELADRALALSMPEALADYQTSAQSMAERLSLLDLGWMGRDSIALEAFARGAAMSDALALTARVDSGLLEAARAFSTTLMPELSSLAAHRALLDASGLWLPRWPRVRLLTKAEKRRRLRQRLRGNAEPPHVRRAKSLVHRYELVLREVVDAAMADTYGEDWAQARLPKCDCSTLLGRAATRGGDPLDHADYAHYRMIMSHEEHHADVFSTAFENPTVIAELIDAAGRLRARSHHAREFSPEDLRDLRVVWRTIEAGLLALTEDVEFDFE